MSTATTNQIVKGCLVEDEHGSAFTVLDVFAGMVSLRSVVTKAVYTGVSLNAVKYIPGKERG